MRTYKIFNTVSAEEFFIDPLTKDTNGVSAFCIQLDLDKLKTTLQTTKKQVGETYNNFNVNSRELSLMIGVVGPEAYLNDKVQSLRRITSSGNMVCIQATSGVETILIKGYTVEAPDVTISCPGFRQVEYSISLTDPYMQIDSYEHTYRNGIEDELIPSSSERADTNTIININMDSATGDISKGILQSKYTDYTGREIIEKLEFSLSSPISNPSSVSYSYNEGSIILHTTTEDINLMPYIILDNNTRPFNLGYYPKYLTVKLYDSDDSIIPANVEVSADLYVSDIPVSWS